MAWSVRDNEVRMEKGITLDEWSKKADQSIEELKSGVSEETLSTKIEEIINSPDSSVAKKTELEQVKGSKYDSVELAGKDIKFYANSSLKKTITLPSDKPVIVNDLTTGGTNKVLSAEQGKKLNEGKIDDVELSGNELIFKCNGVEKKRITLPTGGGA